jgi:CubicO group peptidase (beta-lactamase class C family)
MLEIDKGIFASRFLHLVNIFLHRLEDGRSIHGTYEPGYEAVLDAFQANFEQYDEVGASACLTHHGKTVVDLWGGLRDPQTVAAWERDTVSIVYSCTKGATALCAHMLADRGKLDYNARVADLWPAFSVGGKADTTISMMLDHTSPVPHLREPIKSGGLVDWEYMVERVAAEAAFWEPGTRQGYHGLTYAWTVGNLVRLVAGKPLGSYFAEHVAGPLGLDFQIGLPESDERRVAPMIAPNSSEVNFKSKFFRMATGQAGSLPNLFLTNQGRSDFNLRAFHAAEIGSANGITNARGLAGMYAPLANGGGHLVSAETLARMGRVSAATHQDAVLIQPMRFAMGFMASTDNRSTSADSVIFGERGFGHVGMGGSIGFADPEAGISFGYTMNRMGAGILLNERGQALVDAAYKSLGWRSNATGAWRT